MLAEGRSCLQAGGKSLLEARKVQLECVFQIIFQKIINQHHNYSRVWLSQRGAACRGCRREWCCGSALDTLENVAGTPIPWALSPESLPQPACMAHPPSPVGGQVMVAGNCPPGSSAEDVPAAGLLFLALLGLLDLLERPLGPRTAEPVGLSSSLQHSQGVGGVECNRHRDIL